MRPSGETALGGAMRFDRFETTQFRRSDGAVRHALIGTGCLLDGGLGFCSPSVIAFSLYNAGVIRTGAASAGYLGNLYPVFSASCSP